MAVPFVPNQRVASVEMRYLYANQKCENILWFWHPDTITKVLLDQLCDALISNFYSNIRQLQTANCTLNMLYARSRAAVIAPKSEYTTGLPLAGTNIVGPTTNNNSIAISFSTGMAGDDATGRNFVLGMPASVIDDNRVNAAFRADYLDAYRAMVGTAAVAPGWTWCVYSMRHDNQWRTEGVFADVGDVKFTDDVIDNQRRRLPNRGQ